MTLTKIQNRGAAIIFKVKDVLVFVGQVYMYY